VTLTRQLPSLRRTLPDPLVPDLWPEATVATTTDVVVSGISLVRLVEVYGTPCTHRGAAVVAGTGGRPSPTATSTVTVARVTRVAMDPSGRLRISTDARLDSPRLIWSELRLIDRVSTAHTMLVFCDAVFCDSDDAEAATRCDPIAVDLPLDVRLGDLLAIPSRPLPAAPLPATWLSGLD
jgi:hypothetical protein